MSAKARPGVLFVSRYFSPELIGSAPFSTDIAEWLVLHGLQTTVLCGLPHYPTTEIFSAYRDGSRRRESIRGSSVQRLSVGPPGSDSASSRILNEVRFLIEGLMAIATRRVERRASVLALCPSILSVALGLAARSRGGVCVALVHDVQSGLAENLGMVGGQLTAKLMRGVERLVLNKTNLVVVLSQEMKVQLLRLGVTAPIEVIPLWVDTEKLKPIQPVPRSYVRLLYSGNLGRKQGLGQILGLAQKLAAIRPDIEIELRGSGNQSALVAREIERRGLRRIRVTELQPEEDLSSALATGDIHLVPQNPGAAAFSLPSKVFNIMAVGRPFVATANPGSALWQLQQESKAFLCVPPDASDAFAMAVIRLADDAGMRAELGRLGRAFVEKNYTKPLILGKFMNHLDALSSTQ